MEKEYIISFSSFYKAAYAQEILANSGIRSTLRKLPNELVRSCGTGLYLRADSIRPVKEALEMRQVVPRGIYEIRGRGRGQREYVKI